MLDGTGYQNSRYVHPHFPTNSHYEESPMENTATIGQSPDLTKVLTTIQETLNTDAARWEKMVGHIKKVQDRKASLHDFDEALFAQIEKHVAGLRGLASVLTEMKPSAPMPENVIDATNRFRPIELD